MGWHHDEEETKAGSRPWRELVAWLGCLLAVVMPTAALSTLVQAVDRDISPLFGPALFVGLFTVMVLIVRPWTFR
ncbi:hypothetical protein [Caulobacter sp. RHG1]|jgi:hypothetical protein|uniref:hypothetical protein n=1 Tax=Caulobacter sp. (strain RHG1) TaxID=2545762 RepID=UPI001557A89E|nr:hypothetical protein [Caulobacter sp. RHG1]NQE65341.1 hypothetical protein [Caulobacter sp. RHG1]